MSDQNPDQRDYSDRQSASSTRRSGEARKRKRALRFWIGLALGLTVVVTAWWFKDQLALDALVGYEQQLNEWKDQAAWLVFAAAFAIYVLVTGLSLPGAAALTLLSGWLFGIFPGTILASFASTSGAAIAFLLSRYFFQDSIENRLGDRWIRFQESLDRDGAFYLFTLRLVPAVPFFVINAGMGLTRIRLWTFWWVSQLGMLPGTVLYVYAGSRIPSLKSMSEKGVNAVFTGTQILQITIAFILLGVFPIAARLVTSQLWKLKR